MKHCFCILGWYFYKEFYDKLYAIEGDKYIISHRDEVYIESLNGINERIRSDIFFGENIGLEWGGYYQFIEMGHYEKYDFVIFMHDDLVIKDVGFVEVLKKRFAAEPALKVIGNGKNGKDWQFRFGKYKDRMFFQDDDDFPVRTVRGSFFAARTDIFPAIGNFPVKWKTKTPKKGNVSLRNFGYIISKNFGIDSISYLDENCWLNTQYICEMVRGE
ncbi:MAG: hypothetical protein ACE5I1_08915 [bacterium]